MAVLIPWTFIVTGGNEQSSEDFCASNVRISQVDQAIDECSFTIQSDYDTTLSFDIGNTISIYKGRYYDPDTNVFSGGTKFYEGRVDSIERYGTPEGECVNVILAGPWWYLEKLVFEQSWVFNDGTNPPTTFTSSHVFLGQAANGTRLTTGGQIEEILQWAIASGAPIAIGTGFPEVTAPLDEVKDVTCAEGIRKCLRWHPDACFSWDYSTASPTANITTRSTATALELALYEEQVVVKNTLKKRSDYTAPCVVIKYERVDDLDGYKYRNITTETAPTGYSGTKFNAVTVTINLDGYSITNSSATVTTVAATPTTAAWWYTQCPELSDGRTVFNDYNDVSDYRILSWTSAQNLNTYPNICTRGQLAAWMTYNGSAINFVENTITATVRMLINNQAADDAGVEVRTLTARVVSTDAPVLTGYTFYAIEQVQAGEEPPVGLAASLYAGLQDPHYDGQIVVSDDECGDTSAIILGKVINLTGGLSEWTTMRAQVRKVEMDIDNGITLITVGPPGHLGAKDLVELLRVNRNRWVYTAPSARSTGAYSSSGTVELGKDIGKTIADAGLPVLEKVIITKQGVTGGIKMDVDECQGATLKPRPAQICMLVDGVPTDKYAMVMMSEPQDTPFEEET